MIADGMGQSLTDVVCTEFDTEKFMLGKPCKHGHEWGSTGKTLRYSKHRRNCVECARKKASQQQLKKLPEQQQKRELKKQAKNQDLELRRRLLIQFGGNPETHYLGVPCGEGHDWNFTGHTLRHAGTRLCVLCNRERVKQWRKDNPDQLKYQRSLYGQRHRDKMTATVYRHRLNNPLAYRESCKRHYQKNRDKILLKAKAYRQTEQGKVNIKRANYARKLRIKTNRIPYNASDLQLRLLDFDYCCAYCSTPFPVKSDGTRDFHWDHVYPLSRGGNDAISNLVPACISCNQNKKHTHPAKWYKSKAFYSECRWNFIAAILSRSAKV